MTGIAQLCIQSPEEKGDITGSCQACGIETKEGLPPPFSDTFTGFPYLVYGNCFCPHCHAFFKNPSLRKRSWIANQKEGVIHLKRLEAREYILNPPRAPFAFYLTRAGKRQGWLSGMRSLNYNREKYQLLTDFAGNVIMEKNEVRKMNELIEKLRKNKVSKTQLLSGNYTMYTYRKAIEGDWEDLIQSAREHIKKPAWEVIVYVNE